MTNLADIDNFIRDLDLAQSAGEIQSLIEKSLLGLGFSSFSYMVLPAGRQDSFHVGNHPAVWADHFRAHRRHSVLPYLWRDVKERQVLTVPLRGPGLMQALFAVTGAVDDDAVARHRHRLQLMASYLHDRLIPFMPEAVQHPSLKITARETEILTWTARGKTSWEISTILKISNETVRHHLKSVCRKLGVSNKTQAASLCIAQGMLHP